MSERYLLQVKSGYVYIYTEALARKESDFREIGKEEALYRIENYKPKKEEKVVVEKPKEEIKSSEPVVPMPVDEYVPEDEKPQDEMEEGLLEIRNLKSKNDIEDYMMEKYGIDVDRRKSLSELKNIALEAYENSK